MRATAFSQISLVALLLAVSAHWSGAQAAECREPSAATGYYRTQVQPLFDTYCVACHQDAAPSGGLSLQDGTAPGSLINVPNSNEKMVFVAAGDPAASYLYRKLTGTHLEVGGQEKKMPLGGSLSDSEIALVVAWIMKCPTQD